MIKKSKEYQKLPGFKKGFLIGRHTLWQGTDHLLHIFSRVGFEDYKRYYFNDIQAIIARKTAAGKIQNTILGGFILLAALPAFFFEGGWSLFWAMLGGVMLIFFLIHLLKGPTCETKLLTAVQTEKLPSLNRLRNACSVMDRLHPCIQRAQGTLTREDLDKMPVRRIGNLRINE